MPSQFVELSVASRRVLRPPAINSCPIFPTSGELADLPDLCSLEHQLTLSPRAEGGCKVISRGTVLLRPDGQIAHATTYFCKLIGVSHGKIAGMSCFDFVFPEDLDAAKRLFEINKQVNTDQFSFRLRRVDGATVWVDLQFAAIKSLRGKVTAVSAAVAVADESYPLPRPD